MMNQYTELNPTEETTSYINTWSDKGCMHSIKYKCGCVVTLRVNFDMTKDEFFDKYVKDHKCKKV